MNLTAPIATNMPSRVEERRFLGLPTWIKAGRELTGGQFSLIEQIIPAGFESPWHMHHSEDESFYVIEGQMSVIMEGGRTLLQAGDFAFGPRGIPHGFRIEGEGPARILLMTTGSDFADFIAETSVPSDTPPAAPDMAFLVAAAERHNLAILGPLPK
ncbi:quercetin dioxygenase-like cupin family protein [Pseudochelatococcus lubricantis]|uniref:Quercetin dioxygenase-like cupin family protein n=1 Tax=Pseudochelatococcus lubricantis TaxID=1538102 RepID=A0ABX0V7U1_9HYPH|nr:cupin domain-containing protein [Pseudochelatococcus lubricantis]NIJ59845.1 quercetin dioxygenase-like cupin family protein [Pseudochelatococcus lubricantis]